MLFQHIHHLSSKRAFSCPEVHLKRWQRSLPDFFSGRAIETCLNLQRPSRILFILPLGAECLEWCSVHSGLGMRNTKTHTFYILVILIPELWIKKRAPILEKEDEYMHTDEVLWSRISHWIKHLITRSRVKLGLTNIVMWHFLDFRN